MHGSHPSSRSKSRSPAPPQTESQSPLPSRRPQFRPPSHYAAAAGIPYGARQASGSDGTAAASPRPVIYMPVSYPSDSASELESPLVPKTRHSLLSKKSTANISTKKLAHRKSQIGLIEDLETQLLPSLHDTIGRMTQSAPASNSSTEPAAAPQAPSRPYIPKTAMSTPKSSFVHQSGTPSAAASDISSTPRMHSKSAPRFALHVSNSPATLSDSDRATSKVIRRVKSTVGGSGIPRKTGAESKLEGSRKPHVPVSKKITSSLLFSDPAKAPRQRSSTAPGVVLPLGTPSTSPLHRTPDDLAQHGIDGSFMQARMSGLRSPSVGVRVRSRGAAEDDSSASEIEYEAERLRRQRSRLFVTNAQVVPSSSSEIEPTTAKGLTAPVLRSQLHPLTSASTDRSKEAIGLGIGMERGIVATANGGLLANNGALNGGGPYIERPEHEVTNALYGDANTWGPADAASGSREAKEGRRSVACYGGKRPLQTSVAGSPRYQDSIAVQEDLEQQKKRQRRETLRGLIDVLDSSRFSSTHIPTAAAGEESDCDPSAGFLVSDGLASDASTKPIAPQRGDTNGDEESNYSSDDEYTQKSNVSVTILDTFTIPKQTVGSAPRAGQNDHITQSTTQHNELRPCGRPRSLSVAPSYECTGEAGQTAMTTLPLASDRTLPDHGSTSPGRTPIVRHSIAAVLPTALRRSSVYGSAPPLPGYPNEGDLKQKASNLYDTMAPNSIFPHDDLDPSTKPRAFQAISQLSHTDSDLSSMYSSDSARWQDGDDNLSSGATSMFSQLSGSRRPSKDAEDASGPVSASLTLFYGGEGDPVTCVVDADIQTHSASHGFQSTIKPLGPCPVPLSHPPIGDESHRRTHLEILYKNEAIFSDRMQVVVNVFIKPLRQRGSKAWVEGVPSDIGRLFDWLEDIAVLHSQICSTLEVLCNERNHSVEPIGQALRGFVPRLEVYQPYIVRRQSSMSKLLCLVEDPTSDFGEFIRMQERSVACQGRSIEKLLHDPFEHLMSYPTMFTHLLSTTPKDHPDYIASVSLLHSTNTIIRVMNEVKDREDEYDLVKEILAGIQDLPTSIQLARRERRLLARGHLKYAPATRMNSNITTSQAAVRSSVPSGQCQAISNGMPQRGYNSVDSLVSEKSDYSDDAPSIVSTGPPTTPKSVRFDFGPSKTTKLSAHGAEGGGYVGPNLPTSTNGMDMSPVYVLVFTDLVLLTRPLAEGRKSEARWQFCEGGGIYKVMGVSFGSDIATLDLLPISAEEVDTGVISEHATLFTSHFYFPEDDDDERREGWQKALRRCFEHTLHSLSFLSHSGKYLGHGTSVDLRADTKESVLSILATGLPLPKSPSIQIEEAALGDAPNRTMLEREERGWWALRFQQILREMQRREG